MFVHSYSWRLVVTFPSAKEPLCIHWDGGWVDSRTCLDALENESDEP